MGRTRVAKATIRELKRRIFISKKRKKRLTDYLERLNELYSKRKISYAEYTEILHKDLGEHKTINEWIQHYDFYIRDCERKINKHKRGIRKTKLPAVIFSVVFIAIILSSVFIFDVSLTGLFVQEEIPTDISEVITTATTQQQAILNQPVKWTQTISLDEPGKTKIGIPLEATDISVNKISETYSEEINETEVSPTEDSSPSQEKPLSSSEAKFSITGAVISEAEGGFLTRLFRNIGRMTGFSIQEPIQLQEIEINDTATEYEIEYETPAPYAIEEEIENGKRVKIVGPETIHYENVLAFTNLPESLNVKTPSQIRIHWIEQDSYIPIQTLEDKNANGIYDYIEWIDPELSNQTFEIEIVIIDAEHLDKNRNFVANIYEYVNETDGITYTIPENEHVRAYFERNLTNENFIDVYVKNTESVTIEIYEKDSSIIIGQIDISGEGKYYIDLNHIGSQSIFDLKSVGGDIIYDYIHDATTNLTVTACDSEGTGACTVSNIDTSDANFETLDKNEHWVINYSDLSCNTITSGEACLDVWSQGSGETVTFECSVDGSTWDKCGTNTWDPGASKTRFCYPLSGVTCANINDLRTKLTSNDASGPNDFFLDYTYIYVDYTEVVADENYPQFSDFTVDPTNDTAFSNQGTNYKINSTITFTNSTAGIEMNGVANYSATNVSDAFSVAITNLSAGIYDYFWWAFGNGTSEWYNKSATSTYSVAKSSDSCSIYFNESSSLQYPGTFLVWTNCTSAYNMYINGSPINNNSEHALAASAYNFSVLRTDASNYTNYYHEQEFQITPAAGVVSLFLNGNADNHTVEYTTNSNISSFTNNGVPTIYQNGSDITANNNVNMSRAANYYNITAILPAGGNYTYASKTYWLTVTKSIPQGTLENNESWGITYPTAVNISYTESNSGDSDLNYLIYRDGISVGGTESITHGFGDYTYIFNTTSGTNYTVNASMDSKVLSIAKSSDSCSIYFNESSSLTYPGTFIVWTNCTSTYNMYINGSPINNDSTQALAAGAYNFSVLRTDALNYTNYYDEQEFQVSKATGVVSLFLNGNADNHTVEYTTNSNVSALSNNGGLTIYQNGSDITANNNVNMSRAVNYYNITAVSAAGENYTYASKTYWLTVTKVVPQGTLENNESWSITYPTAVNISYAESNTGDEDLAYLIYRDGISVGGTESITHGVGDYTYIFNTTSGTNYTANASMDSKVLSVAKSSDSCSIYFNESSSLQYPGTFLVWTNCTSTYNMYRNESPVNNDSEQILEVGAYNFSVMRTDALNYTNYYDEQEFQISPISDVPPEIYGVTSISPVTLTDGPGATYIVVNFSVSDENGADNLVNSSATINFTKAGEDLRINSTCAVKDYAGNYANYTCNVTMWWWDIDGNDWTVYANITDQESNLAINDTTTFTVNTLTGFGISSTALSFGSLVAGATNQTPSDYFILNNTGNQDIIDGNVRVNATDLFGETNKGQALWASNFSMSPFTGGNIECNASTTDATAMVNMSYTGVVGSALNAGNFTKNDGEAQEDLYLCLRQVGLELDQQQYSTDQLGAWTIKIYLLVAVIPANRRKKKKKKKKDSKLIETLGVIVSELRDMKSIMGDMREKEKISKQEIIEILELRQKENVPVTIFTKELGGLEAVSKYMKENLGMNYSEIAKLLMRDERTIWTAYKKALEKQKEMIKAKDTTIFIPISIFSNRNLTILESVVVHLKIKGMKHIEIAKLINRDQRNVQTIYSRAIKKLKK